MYIGARKLTGINTFLNLVGYTLIVYFMELKLDVYSVVFLFFTMTIYYIFNGYSLERGRVLFSDFLNSLVVSIVLIIFSYKIIPIRDSVSLFFFIIIVQNLLKVLMYYFFVKNRNILIIGKNKISENLKKILMEKQMYNIADEINISSLAKIDSFIEKMNISKIIITEDIKERCHIEKLLEIKLKGVQVLDYLSFIEKVEEKVPVDSINEEWILYGNGFTILYDGIQGRIKRIFDITCAIIIAIITSPIMLISTLIIKIESKGKILYIQKRVGLGNKEFNIYKFRSMGQDAERNGAQWAEKNDPRVTKFGNIMRKTRIDELPQLWNVIKGDMTFVGPRPERMIFIKELEKGIPFYNIRHCVKPGLTGWAQVKYSYGASIEDAFQKLQYDLYYIKHQNLILDFVILFKTIKTVIFGRGR